MSEVLGVVVRFVVTVADVLSVMDHGADSVLDIDREPDGSPVGDGDKEFVVDGTLVVDEDAVTSFEVLGVAEWVRDGDTVSVSSCDWDRVELPVADTVCVAEGHDDTDTVRILLDETVKLAD